MARARTASARTSACVGAIVASCCGVALYSGVVVLRHDRRDSGGRGRLPSRLPRWRRAPRALRRSCTALHATDDVQHRRRTRAALLGSAGRRAANDRIDHHAHCRRRHRSGSHRGRRQDPRNGRARRRMGAARCRRARAREARHHAADGAARLHPRATKSRSRGR